MQTLTFNQTASRHPARQASLFSLALLLAFSLLPAAQASSYASSSSSAVAVSYAAGGSGTSACNCCCNGDVQDKAIKKLIHDHAVVTVTLVSGIKVQGVIKAADCTVVIIECNGICQLIYKSAIAAIIPNSSVLTY